LHLVIARIELTLTWAAAIVPVLVSRRRTASWWASAQAVDQGRILRLQLRELVENCAGCRRSHAATLEVQQSFGAVELEPEYARALLSLRRLLL
jgi:hypothetical protein